MKPSRYWFLGMDSSGANEILNIVAVFGNETLGIISDDGNETLTIAQFFCNFKYLMTHYENPF